VSDLAVGDRVAVQLLDDERGRIVTALARRNALARRGAGSAFGRHVNAQVIAANLDRVVAVMAASQPAPKWNLLDRYLVSAEAAGIPALICITKADLARQASPNQGRLPDDAQAALDNYRRIGYPVIVTSAAGGQGLDELRQALSAGTSALIGKSGVGKTSLLNALQPGLGLRVKAVSDATEKGRHTTTHLELFPLESGGGVVDTPGMREFGLWQVDESDLALYFPEMRPYIGQCRFGLNCRHDEEPGCAVRRAVMDGAIDPRRYRSFQRLRLED
jgi:ribosome biogenesis GTPase